MYSFQNDYAEGGHPRILQRLMQENLVQQTGYGADEYAAKAKELLGQRLENPDASIYFVSGGTQANLLVISSLLRNHEAVISASSGHIFTHETGAIEATGHRVIPVTSDDGKLRPADLGNVLQAHTLRPHVVKPKMVYISNSTEVGSVYTYSELKALSDYCRANALYLYMDGARLGQALTSPVTDLKMNQLKDLLDVFYIGGTKNGALLGEAIVFNTADLAPEFDYALKQRGALLSKGRVLSIQFFELFQDDLYFELARHANEMAFKMATAFSQYGFSFLSKPESNQIFPILPHQLIERLRVGYRFYDWQKMDENHSAIRLITSWATEESVVDQFIADLAAAAPTSTN